MKKVLMVIKKAPTPAILTIISFVLFLVVYLFINLTTVEPYWFIGLVFALPFISFGFVTYLTTKDKINKASSEVISLILTIALGFVSLYSFFNIAIAAATTETTDVNKYQRVLRITNYPKNRLTKHFPRVIPDNANNISFRYHPAFMQGGEELILKFETSSVTINQYINDFKDKVIWTGNINDNPSAFGIIIPGFGEFGYKSLPEDFIIYVFLSDNSNHGELSLVAISKVRNEIIFYAENWWYC